MRGFITKSTRFVGIVTGALAAFPLEGEEEIKAHQEWIWGFFQIMNKSIGTTLTEEDAYRLARVLAVADGD